MSPHMKLAQCSHQWGPRKVWTWNKDGDVCVRYKGWSTVNWTEPRRRCWHVDWGSGGGFFLLVGGEGGLLFKYILKLTVLRCVLWWHGLGGGGLLSWHSRIWHFAGWCFKLSGKFAMETVEGHLPRGTLYAPPGNNSPANQGGPLGAKASHNSSCCRCIESGADTAGSLFWLVDNHYVKCIKPKKQLW